MFFGDLYLLWKDVLHKSGIYLILGCNNPHLHTYESWLAVWSILGVNIYYLCTAKKATGTKLLGIFR